MLLGNVRYSLFMRILYPVMILALLPLQSPAAEYFVTPSGADTNTGGNQAPFKTIGRGLFELKAGDILTIGPGKYNESCRLSVKGAKESPVSVRGAGEVSLEPAGDDGFLIADSTYVTVEGIRILAPKESGFVIKGCDQVRLEGCAVSDSGKSGIRVSRSDHVTIRSCPVSGSKEGHGIYITSSEHAEVIDCVIVEKNALCGVCISGAAAEGGDGLATGVTVSRNIMKGNGAKGGAVIRLEGVEKSTIENNVCDGNLSGGIECLKGEGVRGGSRNKILGNVMRFDSGKGLFGIRLADGSTNTKLQQNTIVINAGPAISVDGASAKGFKSSFNFFPADIGGTQFCWKGESMDLAKWQQTTGEDMDSHLGTPASRPPAPASSDSTVEAK